MDSMFLMSGKLHFPIRTDPGGVFYRGRGVIHAVFVSRNDSIVRRCVVQPALLFRGIKDSLAAGKNGKREALSSKMRTRMRWTVLFCIYRCRFCVERFRDSGDLFHGDCGFAGIVGIMIIGFMSKRRHVAMHCSSYCLAGDFGYVFETSVSVAIASERSLPTLHGFCNARVSVRGSVESRRAERASGNQLYFVWRLSCGVRS